jgi:sulfide:quinone oxidoreductase
MALHDLAGPRVAMTLLSPASEFVYQPLSVREPFANGPADSYPLASIAADFDVELIADELDWVAPGHHAVFTKSGTELPYDLLVLALGARREQPFDRVTTFCGSEDSEALHGLVQDVETGYTRRVAFVVPPGVTWALPLYELALMTARRAREMGGAPELTLITPEEAPLAVLGSEASGDVAALLGAAGIALETTANAEVHGGRLVTIRPAGKVIEADRVVALPVLHGTAPRGIPADADGFIAVDGHGRITGAVDVYAAGDGVQFPIKQGGIATQQADAVAEVIAKRAGVPLVPLPFRPVVHGKVMTGGSNDRSLGADKIAGLYLAPYLAARQPRVTAAGRSG